MKNYFLIPTMNHIILSLLLGILGALLVFSKPFPIPRIIYDVILSPGLTVASFFKPILSIYYTDTSEFILLWVAYTLLSFIVIMVVKIFIGFFTSA